jgi:hypothetical protein
MKQSAGSRERPPPPPEDFVLYLDENLHNCKPILEALVQRGVRHERHGQHFAPGAEDSVWLPFVGQRGWIVLTKDKRIRFNQLEKTAMRRYRVREFYFSSGNYSGAEMAEILVAALPKWSGWHEDLSPFHRQHLEIGACERKVTMMASVLKTTWERLMRYLHSRAVARQVEVILQRVDAMAILDDCSPDEILRYDEHGLPG